MRSAAAKARSENRRRPPETVARHISVEQFPSRASPNRSRAAQQSWPNSVSPASGVAKALSGRSVNFRVFMPRTGRAPRIPPGPARRRAGGRRTSPCHSRASRTSEAVELQQPQPTVQHPPQFGTVIGIDIEDLDRYREVEGRACRHPLALARVLGDSADAVDAVFGFDLDP